MKPALQIGSAFQKDCCEDLCEDLREDLPDIRNWAPTHAPPPNET